MPNRYQDRPPASFSFGGYRTGDSIADIIMARGQAAADAELRGGEIWGNAFQNVGQTLAGGFQEYGRQQEERKAQEALARARSGAYPAATKPVRGSEFDVPDPGIDHFDAILKTVSPELRPKVEKAIRDADEAASRVESRRMEIEKTKAALAAEERKAQQDGADYGATLAFHVTPFLGAEDGGLSALTTAAQHAKARRIPGAEAYDEFLGKATEAMQQAQQSGDPRAVAAVADSIRKQAEPLLKRMQVGASAGLMEKLRGETEKGVVLGEGATLVDPRDGREIAKGAPKQETRSIEVQLAEAAAKGDTAAFGRLLKVKSQAAAAGRDPLAGQKDKFWVMRDGKPLRVSESEYRPGDKPASTREQGRPVTAGEADKIADYDTSLDDLNALTDAVKGNRATGTAAKIGSMVPNPVTELFGWGSEAKQKQATIDRVKQVIGKALEGGVLRKEDEVKYEKILPTIGDTQEVVASKLDGLWKAIQRRRQTQLDSLSDAGYDVSKYESRAPRERKAPADSGPAKITSKAAYDALPKGAVYIDPTGQVRTKR